MKALILAAGFGKRLQPVTYKIPKAMVPVHGTPLLVNSLNHLTAVGIDHIGIVVGHMADYIKSSIGNEWNGVPVAYFENKRYLETNNIVSLYQAAEFCDEDMLMLECDLFYQQEILERLMEGKGECSILVSPFHPDSMNGTVIRRGRDNSLELILGQWQDSGFHDTESKKTVNIYKFNGRFVKEKYMPLVKWYVENMGKNSYYEKILGCLIYLRECDIQLVEVPGSMWCEIDDIDDLEKANRIGLLGM